VAKRGLIDGVIGYSAEIPCEATPSSVGDAPYLILWYKDIFGTPIYRYQSKTAIFARWFDGFPSSCSYDMREGDGGRHWMERKTFGDRASFHIRNTGRKNAEGVEILRAYLKIENV
jgi:hypothetical protein